MTLSLLELFAIGSVLFAIFMTGTLQLRSNLLLYAIQTGLVGAATAACWPLMKEAHFLVLALAIVLVKAIGVSCFLSWVVRKIHVFRDSAAYLPLSLAMHTCILLLGISHMLAMRLPVPPESHVLVGGAAAGISLVLIGALFMLTRKTAISQVIGFLTMENGIYLFTLTQANGMPMVVELGILLDVLVGVMILGLVTFRIQKSFEHIDVTQLRDLTE
ncbi:MAG: hypothetical protein K8F91_24145 [Candidatus Obscuribacterales bacterium]|nr:hypothetical protein [Candidatus Obscuribacterales bacterium]